MGSYSVAQDNYNICEEIILFQIARLKMNVTTILADSVCHNIYVMICQIVLSKI